MAAIIEINCPECDRLIKAPANGIGKRIKCKGCEHGFIIEDPAKKKKGPAPKKASPKQAAASIKQSKPAKAKETEAEDEGEGAYGVRDMDLAPRCPNCANEMESEEAVICLHCGYNTQTRSLFQTKVLEEQTGGDKFTWLLPGILCVIAVIMMIGYCFFHHYALPGILDEEFGDALATARDKGITRMQVLSLSDEDYAKQVDADVELWHFIFHPGVEIWLVMAALFGSWKAGYFAYKRLVLNPRPPEVEKERRKAKKAAT